MMIKEKMLPSGIEDFEEIITENFYYVDKAGLIRDLLNDWTKVTLFTLLRRFSKTLNMNMLRRFLKLVLTQNSLMGWQFQAKQSSAKNTWVNSPLFRSV